MCKVERQRAKDGGLKGEEGKDKAKEKWGVCIRGLEAGSGCYECETRGGNLAAIGQLLPTICRGLTDATVLHSRMLVHTTCSDVNLLGEGRGSRTLAVIPQAGGIQTLTRCIFLLYQEN